MKRKSKINYPAILVILTAVVYEFMYKQNFSSIWLNFVSTMSSVSFSIYLFFEWKKSRRRFEPICFILSLIPIFIIGSYVIRVLMKQ